MER
ncbi:hypothetical protein GA0061081_11923 [Gilliamella bombicola]|jgi:hypothetical protein